MELWRRAGGSGAVGEPSQTHWESIHLLSSVMLHSPATRNRRVGAESTATATNLSYLLDEIAFKGCRVKRSNLFYKPSKARGGQWETLDSPGRVCSLHCRWGPHQEVTQTHAGVTEITVNLSKPRVVLRLQPAFVAFVSLGGCTGTQGGCAREQAG